MSSSTSQIRVKQSIAACATDLLALINEKHGSHLEAAERAKAEAAEEAAGPSAPTDAFAAMAAAQQVSAAKRQKQPGSLSRAPRRLAAASTTPKRRWSRPPRLLTGAVPL